MRSRGVAALLLVGLLAGHVATVASPVRGQEAELESRLTSFAGRLRYCISIASFSVYAPTLGDLRLQAQQLANLLEGSEGKHFARPADPSDPVPGLLNDATGLAERLREYGLDSDVRLRFAAAMENITFYLEHALTATLASLERRRLSDGTEDMRRTFAYLAAAYGCPSEAGSVPGLSTILHLLDLVEDPPAP
jgi:hypothetical protein